MGECVAFLNGDTMTTQCATGANANLTEVGVTATTTTTGHAAGMAARLGVGEVVGLLALAAMLVVTFVIYRRRERE